MSQFNGAKNVGAICFESGFRKISFGIKKNNVVNIVCSYFPSDINDAYIERISGGALEHISKIQLHNNKNEVDVSIGISEDVSKSNALKLKLN